MSSTRGPGREPAEPGTGLAGNNGLGNHGQDVQNQATAPTKGRARPGRRTKGPR
jgi:hypothetical protein